MALVSLRVVELQSLDLPRGVVADRRDDDRRASYGFLGVSGLLQNDHLLLLLLLDAPGRFMVPDLDALVTWVLLTFEQLWVESLHRTLSEVLVAAALLTSCPSKCVFCLSFVLCLARAKARELSKSARVKIEQTVISRFTYLLQESREHQFNCL